MSQSLRQRLLASDPPSERGGASASVPQTDASGSDAPRREVTSESRAPLGAQVRPRLRSRLSTNASESARSNAAAVAAKRLLPPGWTAAAFSDLLRGHRYIIARVPYVHACTDEGSDPWKSAACLR
eukprot:5464580-Pleurochrysis_carterae.AAC.1